MKIKLPYDPASLLLGMYPKELKPETGIHICIPMFRAAVFPGGSACNAGDLGSTSELGRSPGGGYGNPLQDSCLENPHGQTSLAGCNSWGGKEPDTTE